MSNLEKDPLMEMLGYKEIDDGFQGFNPHHVLVDLTEKEKELAHKRIAYWMNQEPQKSTIERDARRIGVNVEELRSLFHKFAFHSFYKDFDEMHMLMRVHFKVRDNDRPTVDEVITICEKDIFNDSYLRAYLTMKDNAKKEGK